MNKIEFKSFMLQKDGSPTSCNDFMSINLGNNRFAIADGVSKSHFPLITATELCNEFVENKEPIDLWPTILEKNLLSEIANTWNNAVKQHEETLDECDLYDDNLRRTQLPAGSSTLATLMFDAERRLLHYHILGDSTLFIINKQKNTLQGLCTAPIESRGDKSYILYDNAPACVTSTKHSCQGLVEFKVLGEWLSGKIEIEDNVYLAMMTDGIAKWFQDEYLKKGFVVFQELWDIDNQDNFERYVEKWRTENKIDDDVAVILFKVPKDWTNEYEEVYRGDEIFKVSNNDSLKSSDAIESDLEELDFPNLYFYNISDGAIDALNTDY